MSRGLLFLENGEAMPVDYGARLHPTQRNIDQRQGESELTNPTVSSDPLKQSAGKRRRQTRVADLFGGGSNIVFHAVDPDLRGGRIDHTP